MWIYERRAFQYWGTTRKRKEKACATYRFMRFWKCHEESSKKLRIWRPETTVDVTFTANMRCFGWYLLALLGLVFTDMQALFVTGNHLSLQVINVYNILSPVPMQCTRHKANWRRVVHFSNTITADLYGLINFYQLFPIEMWQTCTIPTQESIYDVRPSPFRCEPSVGLQYMSFNATN